MNVSILVLMEVVKEHIAGNRHSVSPGSFNPCFNGSCKRTDIFIFLMNYLSEFQSLF